MSGSASNAERQPGVPIFKTFAKFEHVEFDENSRCIRVDFAQNPRFVANNSFRPIC
jgi:hypothetical protein